MDLVHIDERKWPDRIHWQLYAHQLCEDEHGTWLYVPQGTTAKRGEEAPLRIPHGFVMLVPNGEPWLVEYYWDHPAHPLYINIGTIPEWHGDRVTQVDLDLDVVRRADGSVSVLDEDEFAEHSERFGYPPELMKLARTATDRAVRLLATGAEPFGTAAAPWLRLAEHG